jgi:hypothetical protein
VVVLFANVANMLSVLSLGASERDTSLHFRNVARNACRSIDEWLTEVRAEIVASESRGDTEAANLARKCETRYLVCSLLCHDGGELTSEDALKVFRDRMCLSVVEAHIGRSDEASFGRLRKRVDLMMASRAAEVAQLLSASHEHASLTEIVRGVVGTGVVAPTFTVAWSPLPAVTGQASCCMDGFSDTGMRLTVNIVRGTVLVNGVPPSSLPRSITELPLFQRVFGADRNFAVVPALNGAGIRTSAPFKGADYTFVECEGHLVVREEQQCSHCGTMTTLVLVSPTAQGQQRLWSCGTQLPNRLMKMHSHWYCAELRLVLFGPTAEPHAARSPTVRHLLASGGIEQRLQLAALYAATSSLLPDTRCGMTGAEYAVELLERCWTNRPLRQRESELLHNIAEFAEHMPALTVQCAQLAHVTAKSRLLFEKDTTGSDAKVEYEWQQLWGAKNRNARTAMELLQPFQLSRNARHLLPFLGVDAAANPGVAAPPFQWHEGTMPEAARCGTAGHALRCKALLSLLRSKAGASDDSHSKYGGERRVGADMSHGYCVCASKCW